MLLENVPLTQFIGCTSYGQTKIQLQLWNYKTSCRQLLVPIGYLHDGLKHIPSWFKPHLQLAQQAPWFVHQLLLHPKWNLVWFTNFQHLHKITIKKPTHIALFFVTGSRYPRNTLRSMPMKFQNINAMITLSTLTNTFTLIKTFALDLDIVACNECSILPSKWFLIYLILPNPPTLPGCKLHH